jgi:hypothetical protein
MDEGNAKFSRPDTPDTAAALAGWLGEDRTRATYGLRGDPGRILGILLRGPVEAKVKELLTRSAAEGLKAEVEAAVRSRT